jgi:RNA polymerase sigma factor (sigma-70 family)
VRSSSRDGDSSFDALYRQYRAAVYRSALRDTGDPDEAEDVTQSTFLGAYRAFEHGRRPENPRQWLLAIARNICGRRFRARADPPHEVPLDGALSEESTAEGVPAGELRAVFERLPENQLRVLVLREIRGLSYGEIGQQLGISVPATQMLLFRARRSLRRELEAADLPLPLRYGLGVLLWRLLGRATESPSLAESAGPAAVAVKVIGAAAIATSVVVVVGAPLARRPGEPHRVPAPSRTQQVQQPVLHAVELPLAAMPRTSNPEQAPKADRIAATDRSAPRPPAPASAGRPSDQPAPLAPVLPLAQAPSAPPAAAPSLPPVDPPWPPQLVPALPQPPSLPSLPVPDPGRAAPAAPAPAVTVPAVP